jgi:hypothetical protein
VTSIRRGEDWWHRREDGVWLLWSPSSQTWEPRSGRPPPPPPPPSAPAAASVDAAPTQPLQTSVVPAGGPGLAVVSTPPSVVQAAPAVQALAQTAAVQTPLVQTPLFRPPQAQNAPTPQEPAAVATMAPPGDAAEVADTTPMPAVSDIPLASAAAVAPRPANGEVYSRGENGLLSRFQSQTMMAIGGGIVILALFVLTYVGASVVFRPADEAAAGSPNKKVSARKAFLMQADELCSQASQSAMGLPPPGTSAEMARFTRSAISTQRRLISDMKAIPAPPKQRPLYKAIVSESSMQLGQMRGLLNEAASGDSVGTRAAMETVAASEKRIDRMSANLGLEECSKA